MRSFLLASLLAVAFCVGSTSGQTPNKPAVLLQMIRDTAIHQQLDLSNRQFDRLIEVLEPVDAKWFPSRNFPPEKQGPILAEITQQLRQSLASILNQTQSKRLSELERQALGTRMVLLDDVIDELQLSIAQKQAFNAAFIETDKKSAEIQKKLQAGELKPENAQTEIAALKNKEREAVVGQFTEAQKLSLGSLTGTPFNFSKIKRTYPLAPELKVDGVTWIQGKPVSLKELRGKVVAVHYYAFQCINCKRNLPHYEAWYKDYADKDLVIIGIQTPETSSERKANLVGQAAKEYRMQYPILLDSDAANWRAWGNTMWPTVYLIDKQGFIRRWWQGELNWKETDGEQQMRNTIEMLLSEPS